MERLSTNLIYGMLGSNITDRQSQVFNLTKQINLGKKFASAYEDPVAIIGSIDTQGRIKKNDQDIRDRTTANSDLEAQEVALRGMNEVTDRIHEIAIRAGTGSVSADERLILKDELRSLGETIIQLANSKNGSRYIFSGEQSDLQLLRLNDGEAFNQAVYKHNLDNGKNRVIGGINASISLEDALVSDASSATASNNVINAVPASSGNLVFEINDGNDNMVNFTAAISAGDNLSTIISKINTAFTSAGGLGSLATENPSGYLKLDTANITGNTANESARISLKPSSTTALTGELGLSTKDNFGKEMGLLKTLASLESALTSNNDSGIRALLDTLKFNSRQLSSAQSQIGLLNAQVDRLNSASDDLDIKLQSDLSSVQDIDMIDANIQLANAQAALQSAIQISSNFFARSLSDFIR